MKAILFALIPVQLSAQQAWHKITSNDVGVMVSQAVSGTADGFNQAIQHHHLGRGHWFWDANTSWKNKYKDFDKGDTRARYFGSKNILVFTTDGFHLTRMVSRTATLVTIGLVAGEMKQYRKQDRWKVVAKKVFLSVVCNRAFFVATLHLAGSH